MLLVVAFVMSGRVPDVKGSWGQSILGGAVLALGILAVVLAMGAMWRR